MEGLVTDLCLAVKKYVKTFPSRFQAQIIAGHWTSLNVCHNARLFMLGDRFISGKRPACKYINSLTRQSWHSGTALVLGRQGARGSKEDEQEDKEVMRRWNEKESEGRWC